MEYCFKVDPWFAELMRRVGVDKFYPVGGTVRDLIQGKKPKDFDFAITDFDTTLKVAQEMGLPIHEDGLKFGVIRIGDKYDLATMRSETYNRIRKPDVKIGASIYEDASRRDFTINAMYGKITRLEGDTVCFEPIDFFNGLEDLKNGVLRFVGNPEERIKEHPIRILRAVRFTTKGFRMPEEQKEVVKALKDELEKEPLEQIRQELERTLLTNPGEGLRNLEDFGLLRWVFFEHEKPMAETFHDTRGGHYGESVLQHTEDVMDRLSEVGGYDRVDVFASLYHDIGKPYTVSAKNGKIMFIGHDEKGAEIARDLMRRLRFDNRTINDVANLIKYHMRMNQARESEKQQAKIVAELADKYNYNPEKVREMYERLLKLSQVDTGQPVPVNISERISEPEVTGRELIEWFGVNGDVLKHLKRRAYELQLLGMTPEEIYKVLKGDAKLAEAKRSAEQNA